MNKKNISIDTDFFDDGVEAKLRGYYTQQMVINQDKKASSSIQPYHRSSFDNSVHSYRYQHIPDNQYSDGYEFQQMPQSKIRKLQAANQFQNIISRAMANLFVRCWEEMKSLLPQYSYLLENGNQPQETQQIIHYYNNVFNSSQVVQDGENQQPNSFYNRAQTNEQRKNQIMERQNRGITLDSLSKQKLNRSKSVSKVDFKKSVTLLNPNQQKQTILNQQKYKNQSRQEISRKSYRTKFLEYKHRSRSKDPTIQKSQTYKNIQTYIPKNNIGQNTSFQRISHYSADNLVSNNIRNAYSTSNNIERKNNIFRNINHLLLDRQDICPGQNCNYFVNHRYSSRNIYGTNYQLQSYNHPQSSMMKIHQHSSTDAHSYSHEQEEFVRAQLIEEIVQKLNYSKLRLEEVEKPKHHDMEIIRKISKLEKIILELKSQTITHNKPIEINQIAPVYVHQTQNEDLYRRFIDEISTIRSQIRTIKTLQQIQPQNNTIVDNSSNHIIIEQQKLLSSYQREFERMLNQRQRITIYSQKQVKQVKQVPNNNTTQQKSISDQLIQNSKNTEKKVGWNDGWEIKQVETKTKIQQEQVKSQKSIETVRKNRRTQHLNKDDGFQKYRYTRTQILQSIGLRDQAEMEKRLWRQNQARLHLERSRKQDESRSIAEKSNLRNQESMAQNIKKNKPIRQRYQQQWQKYQKTRIDMHQSSNPCCILFPC